MRTRKQLFTLSLITLILTGTIFCWIKSAHSGYNQYFEQFSVLADVNIVSIELVIARTPGVPIIPEPDIEFQGIRDKLNSAGISLTSPIMPGSNTTESSPPCLRIKIYTHYFTMGDPYAFHVQLAIARPVTIPSVAETPFYAEVWHSEADMGFASLEEVNDKINKTILSQLTSIVNAVRQARKQHGENTKFETNLSDDSQDSNVQSGYGLAYAKTRIQNSKRAASNEPRATNHELI